MRRTQHEDGDVRARMRHVSPRVHITTSVAGLCYLLEVGVSLVQSAMTDGKLVHLHIIASIHKTSETFQPEVQVC